MISSIDTWLRPAVFAGLLLVLLLAESLWPRKDRTFDRMGRWITNFAISIINTAALWILGPLTALGTTYWARSQGYGLFNLAEWPLWVEMTLAILLLDLAIYGQHIATHKIPVLWRLHRVHHTDRDIDTSTALRFHPVEIVLSMLFKCLLVLIIGPAMIAVLLFEILLNSSAMFNHANLRLPLWLDRTLRLFIVTPDMHRVHHSVIPSETNSNYGFFLSWWDRVFKTYKDQPKDGHDQMVIGLRDYQTSEPSKILWSLKLPFQ